MADKDILAALLGGKYERTTAALHTALDAQAFAAAWAEGRAMPPEQAIAYAVRPQAL